MSTHISRITRTAELIAELEVESERFDALGIAVGFEENATFIFADDPSRAEKLSAALAEGGEAIGLIGIKREGKKLTVSSRLYPEQPGTEKDGDGIKSDPLLEGFRDGEARGGIGEDKGHAGDSQQDQMDGRVQTSTFYSSGQRACCHCAH
jgi:hypothetical protein